MHFKRKTKIVATVGPASESKSVLSHLVEEGMDAARLNFSHGSHAEHLARIRRIRSIEHTAGRPLAIIGDLQGPKIRIGKLPDEGVRLEEGSVVTLDTRLEAYEGDALPLPSAIFRAGTRKGHRVFLDDGLLLLEVLRAVGGRFWARVLRGGTLLSRKGVNVPMLELRQSPFGAKDRDDLTFAVRAGVDYLALSFLRSGADVRAARRMLGGAPVKLIAKIERPEALANLEGILAEADAVMVARGDLGIETPLWELPVRQKEIVEAARERMVPVIVATQMLDSMVRNRIPTRAEVSDVANAVYDAADAVMLSAESASGRHPVEAVRMMRRILEATEEHVDRPVLPEFESGVSVNLAVARSAARVAAATGSKFILAGTVTGFTARAVSQNRPRTPIVALASTPAAARSLALVWGIAPIVFGNIKSIEWLSRAAVRHLKAHARLVRGDRVVFLSGRKAGAIGETDSVSVILVS